MSPRSGGAGWQSAALKICPFSQEGWADGLRRLTVADIAITSPLDGLRYERRVA